MQKLGGGRNLHTIVIILFLAVSTAFPAFSLNFPTEILTIGKNHFTIELALTAEQQQKGLMFRKHLANDHGMLFAFDTPRPISMWMKNTLIPLDMLFINSEGKIVYIARNAVPESETIITTPTPVKAVLELAGGVCEKQNITVGDTIHHAIFTHPAD